MKKLFGMLAAFAVGCSSVTVPEQSTEGQSLSTPGSAKNLRYGIWVGKGPRIVSEDGKPLTNALVRFVNDEACSYLAIDDDGRVIMNRYLAYCYGSDVFRSAFRNLIVECPGYHTLESVDLLNGNGVIDEVRMSPVLGQPPCRTSYAKATLGDLKSGTVLGFDLVEGDWMPPLGWGRVEDLRVCVNTNGSTKSFNVSSSGVTGYDNNRSRELSANFEFVRDGDGFGKDALNYMDCTNRIFNMKQYDGSRKRSFAARGYFGSIDEIRLDRSRQYYYEHKMVDGKHVSERREYPEQLSVLIGMRVNTEPGLKKLESFSSVTPTIPPVFHPVPEDGVNRMAFGVSEDGKSAVCFGWTKSGAKVPEIFRRGVYSQDPVKELSGIETMYLEPCDGSDPLRLNGFSELRTVVVMKDWYQNGTYGPRSLADNPRLNAVVFPRRGGNVVVADNTFEGCAAKLTAVYIDAGHDAGRPWDSVAVSNVFTRMSTVYTVDIRGAYSPAQPRVDALSGTVELPVLELADEHLEERFPDGRVCRYCRDGRTEKLRK